MTALTLVLVILTAGTVAWLAFEVLRLRRREAGHAPSSGVGGDELAWIEEVVGDFEERVSALEARMPGAIRYVGAVAYDAYGDLAGALSRSVALLSEEATGVVVTHLVGRTESRFFIKGVVGGRGDEPLSPEEEEAVRQALAG